MSAPYELLPDRRGAAPKEACFVYLVTAGDGPTKIGLSADPKKRLAGLGTSSHEKLKLEHTWRVRSRAQAEALEARLHALFRWARHRREWFGVEPRFVRSVGAHLLAGREAEAEELADVLREHAGASADYWRAFNELKSLHPRWGADRRRELQEDVEEASERLHDHNTRALSLGLEASLLDKWLAENPA
jgi:predicted GIY-YIG superfamily endonuclease